MRYQESVEIYQRGRAEYEAEARASGLKEGLHKGLAPLLRQCQRKLGRELTAADQETLLTRLSTVGADRFGDVVLDLGGPALDRWLRDPNAT